MSDGAAAAVVVAAERAAQLGLTPLARFVTFTTAGVKPELFGLGPVPAVRKALRLAGLALRDIDLVELNEAFAAQVLACLKELPIDPDLLNVNGGAIALATRWAAPGPKLTATLLHELRRRQGRYGLVTMCVGGGMGAAGISSACDGQAADARRTNGRSGGNGGARRQLAARGPCGWRLVHAGADDRGAAADSIGRRGSS